MKLAGGPEHWKFEDGRWWYHTGGVRFRGEGRICPACLEPFITRAATRPTVYCSRVCAGTVPRPGRPGKRPGPLSHSWKGGRNINKAGYVMIWAPDHPSCQGKIKKYVLEHRLVMEQILGRPLLPTETVHHKDGNRQNNDPTNLELRAGPHGPGASQKHCPTCTCFEHD